MGAQEEVGNQAAGNLQPKARKCRPIDVVRGFKIGFL